MIKISIDEKACVGCSLCVDVCPTKVFTYNEKSDIPELAKPKECFGCMSCTEICPASAIAHEEMILSECFYHDDYAVGIAKKLLTEKPVRYGVIRDEAGLAAAMGDISVRLLSVGAVLKDVVGAGLPSVGLMAGRSLASQLPRYQPAASLAEALLLAKREFSPAWDIECTSVSDDSITVRVNQCFVRTLCTNESKPLGGELCILFLHYLTGYLGRMSRTQLKMEKAERGEQCSYDVKVLR